MREFVPATVGLIAFGSLLGVLSALIFDNGILTAALVGGSIPALIMLGFYICFMLVVIGFKELFKGGR